MSINMTQAFKFETDSLESFERMLHAAVRVMFRDKKTKHTQLFITSQKQGKLEGGHGDGWDNVPSVIDLNGQFHHLNNAAMYHGAPFMKLGQKFASKDEAASAAHAKYQEPKPTRMRVATLADYKPEMERDDLAIPCNTYDRMVIEAVARMQKITMQDLVNALGDGCTSWFNNSDGSIGLAYRMHYGPMGGWNKLYLSVTHAYYGK